MDTGVDCDWLNDHILPHMSTEFQTELDSPNVLTLDLSVDVVGATAIPNTVPLGDCVEAVSRLRVDLVDFAV